MRTGHMRTGLHILCQHGDHDYVGRRYTVCFAANSTPELDEPSGDGHGVSPESTLTFKASTRGKKQPYPYRDYSRTCRRASTHGSLILRLRTTVRAP